MGAESTNQTAATQKQAEFGCYTRQIAAGIDKGALLCGQKVGQVEITGTRTLAAANQAQAKK